LIEEKRLAVICHDFYLVHFAVVIWAIHENIIT